jgi:1,4-alpha-glucan branching enzyme
VFGRDPESSKQVWSSIEGYPGDYDYREFYRDVGFDLDLDYIRPYLHPDGSRISLGIKYYRITGKTDAKAPYVPEWARGKAEIHAGNFIFNREQQIAHLASRMDRPPIVCAPYDAELFGHWWYEGPQWLDFAIRKIASEQQVFRLTTPAEYLEHVPVHQVVTPSSSSWGYQGYHEVWIGGANDWIYPHLHWAAIQMGELARTFPDARGRRRKALVHAARQLLLAQASDWPFILHAGTVTGYAARRVREHLGNFRRLHEAIIGGRVDPVWLASLEARDGLFPGLDYRLFAPGRKAAGWGGAEPAARRNIRAITRRAVSHRRRGRHSLAQHSRRS